MLESVVRTALAEDIGSGDLTTHYFCDPKRKTTARIVSREACVLSGLDVARETFRQVDSGLVLRGEKKDGAKLNPGEYALEIEGSAASILTAERVALNFMQRLSGIATLTSAFVDTIHGTSARILDTRKTTPGLRFLEKAAVLAGGGVNHRMGLYDMVVMKDNHLTINHGVDFLRAAIAHLKAEHPDVRVELEADRLEQVKEFLELQDVDRILLDNMSLADMSAAVKLNAGLVELEASGGVNLTTIRGIAETGVDFISVGALTHSARAVDFSMEFSA